MNISIILAVSLALPQAEFAKYHEAVTGRAPEAGALSLAVDPSVSKTGKDAYTIVSEGAGAKITGSNLRSVFYGVYDLLERRGGCHWFWDGDVVPKKPSIDLSGLDVHEEAQFIGVLLIHVVELVFQNTLDPMRGTVDLGDALCVKRGADHAVGAGIDDGSGAAGLAENACSAKLIAHE